MLFSACDYKHTKKGECFMIQSIKNALARQDFSVRSSLTRSVAMRIVRAILADDYSSLYDYETEILGDIIVTGDGRKDSVILMAYEKENRRVRVHFQFDKHMFELPEEHSVLTKESLFFANGAKSEDFVFDCFRGWLVLLLERAVIYAICDGLFTEKEFLAKDSFRKIDFLRVKDSAQEYFEQMQILSKAASDALAEGNSEKVCDAFHELKEVQRDLKRATTYFSPSARRRRNVGSHFISG